MTASAIAAPPVLATTARVGCPPVAMPDAPVTTAAGRGLAWLLDIVGTMLLFLAIPIGVLIVGVPIALAVRAVLYLLGQL